MIELDEVTHTYRYAGRVVPSVTQSLQVIENFDRVDPQVLEAARIFGSHVHLATDLYDRGVLDEEALDPGLVPHLAGWKLFLYETGFQVTHSERIVHNANLGYAGKLDRLGVWKRSTWLIDLKSGAVPRSAGPQTAGYREALPSGERPRRRLVVQLKPNAYRLYEQTDPADWSIFVSCLNVTRFLNRGREPNARSEAA